MWHWNSQKTVRIIRSPNSCRDGDPNNSPPNLGQTSTTDKIIKAVVITITTAVTILAMWYVYKKMNETKPVVIYERRKARQAKLSGNDSTVYLNAPAFGSNYNFTSSTSVFNPHKSDSSLPYGSRRSDSPEHQQWDAEGRAVNYAPDSTLYAPQPKRPAKLPSTLPTSRTDSPAQMAERERPFGVSGPVRQDTASSNTSWNAPQGNNSYPMSRTNAGQASQVVSPVATGSLQPLATSTPPQAVASPPIQQAQYTPSQPPSIAPPSYVSSPPVSQPHSPITPHTPQQAPTNPFAVPTALQAASFQGNRSQQPTPTQAYFAQSPQGYQSPQVHVTPPFPYAQPQVYSQAQQPHLTGGHVPEATDVSYYTAQGHSTPGTEDAYASYNAEPSLK